MDEIFVDGILGAGFSQGAVRIDFHSIANIAQGSKEPRMRLIMTTEGFVEAYTQMTAIMEQLKKTAAARGGASAAGQAAGVAAPVSGQTGAASAGDGKAGVGQAGGASAGAGRAGVGAAEAGATASPAGNISPNF